jgi:AcrR family transcriptional regulator
MTKKSKTSTVKEAPDNLSPAAQRFLNAASDELLKRGLGDGSLRGMAARLDTSHRMLIYHFGSADAFWDAVLTHIRHIELDSRPVRNTARAVDTEAEIVAAWERFSAPQYLPVFELLFELYGRAIHDRTRFQHFLDGVVSSWLEPLTHGFKATLACDVEQADIRARLALAAFRGLLLDLITTGDRKATTAAAKLLARTLTRPDQEPRNLARRW